MSLSSSRLATSLIVLGLACGDTGPTTPVASTFTLFGGNNQVSPAGQQLATALGVIARNTSGIPVGGVTVNWAVASGGGSVAPMSTTTDSGGRASSNWTLGPNAGTQTATATVTGLAPVTFTAIGRIQGAVTIGAKFQRQLLDTVLATTPDFPVIAQALNESNVPVQGVIVNWTASGGGAVSQAVDTTDAGGESQVNYTYGATAGTYGAQATVTGLVGSPVNFTLTAGAGNPTVLAGHAGNNLNAAPGTQVIHTVITRDSHGNPRNGVTIDWALGTGGGSLSTNQNITGGDGTASVTRTIGLTNPNQTVTATAAGLPGGPSVTFTTIAVFTVTVGPGTAFSPNNLTIPLHFPVKFLWATGNTLLHNVTFDPITGAPATITDRTAGDVNTAWHDPGTFTYQCTNHPGMTGQIVVQP